MAKASGLHSVEEGREVAAISPEETLFFIERHGLMGRGIGYVDASILASTVFVWSPFICPILSGR